MAFESKRNLRPPPRVPLRKVHGVDYQTQQLQKHVDEATKTARANPQAQGREVSVTATGAGEVTVSHGLGRKPKGYNVSNRTAACDDFLVSSTSRSMTLNISAAATLTLWVY